VQHHSTHHHLYKFWVVQAFSTRISLQKIKNFTYSVKYFSSNFNLPVSNCRSLQYAFSVFDFLIYPKYSFLSSSSFLNILLPVIKQVIMLWPGKPFF
jgi:hypothetical protein